jgi:hypothetical protein
MFLQGPACDDITDSGDEAVISATGPFFKGNLVKLTAFKAPSPDFNILSTRVGGQEVLTVRV